MGRIGRGRLFLAESCQFAVCVPAVGIAERKEREKAERRRSILDAARDLIRDKAFEEITMDDIAKELELSRATLYLYFSNKSEIYITLLTDGMEDLLAAYRQALETSAISAPWDKMRAMAVAFFRFYAENHRYFDLLVNKSEQLVADSSPEATARFHDVGHSLIVPIADVYREGVHAGNFADYPPDKMAYMLRAVAIGVAVGFREGKLKFPEDVQLMEQLIIHGLRGPLGRE